MSISPTFSFLAFSDSGDMPSDHLLCNANLLNCRKSESE